MGTAKCAAKKRKKVFLLFFVFILSVLGLGFLSQAISHRLSGFIDADTVHIMERGHVMESGSPQSHAWKEGWYARYKRLEELGWRIS